MMRRLDVRIITPFSVDGEQYITLLVGWGGGAGHMKHVDKLILARSTPSSWVGMSLAVRDDRR